MATVPNWWQQGATQINPLEQTYGFDGSQSDRFGMNNYDAILKQLGLGHLWTGGAVDDPSQGAFKAQDVQDWLTQNGYSMYANQGAGIGGGADTYQNLNWIQDAQGNMVGNPSFNRDDPNGVLKAIALAAAGYFGGSALAGAGEAGAAGAATGGADAATSAAWANGAGLGADTVSAVGGGSAAGSLAPLAGIEGMGVTVPELSTAGQGTLGTSAGLSPELQAISAGGSMAGGSVASGYAPIGVGEALNGGGLLSQVGNAALQNPKLVGALAGGLLGGSGGGSSSGGAVSGGSSGVGAPMSQGGWSPKATPQYMQVPTFGGNLPTTGNANSGLWRYAGQQPQQAGLMGAQQPSPGLLGPANQTQWQQPTGPTFNLSGQQLSQGTAMAQQNNPAQPTFTGVGYGSPAVDTTTPSPVSSGGSPSTAPAGFADLYRNHIGNASMSDEDAASRLATAARRYQMFGQSSDGVFGFTPESFQAYQSGNLDAFKGALGTPAQKAPDPMYRYTGNAAGQAASDQAFANLDAWKKAQGQNTGLFKGVGYDDPLKQLPMPINPFAAK